MPAGGYIASNGIACCFGCHDHAERDALDPGGLYSPARLRAAIGETPRELADLLLALDLGRALTREQKTGLRLLAGDISPTKWVAWSAATIAADWRDLACATGAADWTEQRAARER